MSDYATLYDATSDITIEFMMNPAWQPAITEIGSVQYELGGSFGIVLSDGTRGIAGTMTIVSTSDTMDAQVIALLSAPTTKVLTMPNGDTYTIYFTPGTARKGSKQFSLMQASPAPPINTWTVDYIEVAS